ncbi:hypothetical protein QCA50_013370 [Cerrena zonata]|uniref:ATP-dependent RNA helicase n=1 Tax=Cerrena zonata TaxID=2478898 RepID=A0AAW0FQG2_9APHY
MASMWMRAAKASSHQASLLLRASRTGLVLPRQVHHSFPRYTSAAAHPKPEEVVEHDDPLPAHPKEVENTHTAVEGDNPEFSTLKGRINSDLLKAIIDKPMKHTHMSPVQAQVLPLLPELIMSPSENAEGEAGPKIPRDLLVKARTGTGKTLAFLVPIIEARLRAIGAHCKQAVIDAGLQSDKSLETRAKRLYTRQVPGALILSPTRELAAQIAEEAIKLTSHTDLEVRLFVGGVGKRQQLREWMRGRRDIVVGTPGRIRDLLENEPDVSDSLPKATNLVLDEADTLLELGFREDIDYITSQLPKAPIRQTFLFSATVSRLIQQVARATLDKNHKFIDCVANNAAPVHAHIPQYHTLLPGPEDQIPHILRLLAHDQLSHPKGSKVMVFLPTTRLTQLFATIMRELSSGTLPNGHRTKIYEIHSKRTQEQRTKTSDMFRKDRSAASVLVTSDVSARGVDYPGVTRVIQVGIPGSPEQYVHRVGRTGRGNETVGRTDLVLLPWEVGFVTWQLTDIPLKPLTITELKSQVQALADEHDLKASVPFTPVLERIEERVQTFLPELEEDSIRECFMAGIGYYLGRSGDLRVQRSVVLEGMKQWSVKALGLPTPPYVSETFLERMGAKEHRSFQKSKGHIMPSKKNFWEGRGRVRERRDDDNEDGRKFGVKYKEKHEYKKEIGEYSSRQERGGPSFGLPKKRWEDRDGDSEDRKPWKSSRYEGGDSEDRKPWKSSRHEDGDSDGERKPFRRPSRFDNSNGEGEERRSFRSDRGKSDGFSSRKPRYGSDSEDYGSRHSRR